MITIAIYLIVISQPIPTLPCMYAMSRDEAIMPAYNFEHNISIGMCKN